MDENRMDLLAQRARMLRKRPTEAELLLWHHLRARKIAGFKFRRQVVIVPYIVDFACFEASLIIEADGGQHVDQLIYDVKRSDRLESAGYRVLRFWNHEILNETGSVPERIYQSLKSVGKGSIPDSRN
mgnify:FL=1